MTDREIAYIPLDEIKRDPTNAKGHDAALIEASIGRLGYIAPASLDERTGLLAEGHGRLDALTAMHARGDEPPDGIRKLKDGRWAMPVTRGWSSANDEEAARALIVLNRATELGGWMPELLHVAVGKLPDLELTGWARLEDLPPLPDPIHVREHDRSRDGDGDDPPVPDDVPVRVNLGDVWAIGRHRLVCGDCRDPATLERLLDGSRVNVAFTSPPYADRRKYDESSGFRPVPPDEYVEWFAPVAANVAAHLAEDGSWFVNIRAGAEGLDKETYVLDLVLAHVREWCWHWSEEFCWERPGVPKQVVWRFKNAWESVFQFTRGEWKFRPDDVRHESANVPSPTGGFGMRERRNGRNGGSPLGDEEQGRGAQQMAPGEFIGPGLAYPSNRLPTFAGSHEATGHTAAFPVGLPAWFLRAYSDEGDVVLDPFCGSGSTLLAAERENRVGFGVEISPGYCDVILARAERAGLAVERVSGG